MDAGDPKASFVTLSKDILNKQKKDGRNGHWEERREEKRRENTLIIKWNIIISEFFMNLGRVMHHA